MGLDYSVGGVNRTLEQHDRISPSPEMRRRTFPGVCFASKEPRQRTFPAKDRDEVERCPSSCYVRSANGVCSGECARCRTFILSRDELLIPVARDDAGKDRGLNGRVGIADYIHRARSARETPPRS